MEKIMSINQRSADRLDGLAAARGVSVKIAWGGRPRVRWYSVGNLHGGRWHQIAGFTEIGSVERFLEKFGVVAS
jgi:hypothetical protein